MKRYLLYTLLLAVVAGGMLMMFSSCTNSSKSSKSTDEKNKKHDYVDLGLPSGTLWATMNIGADEPEDYGDYFAWGETEPKHDYDWSNYKWCDGAHDKLTKYCVKNQDGKIDNKTELDPDDDAATANWGSEWCMPSKEQVDELVAECNWEWTTKNGVKGYLVTSKRNDASLFLPAAGVCIEGGDVLDDNYSGHYWLRTLDVHEASRFAFVMYFESASVDCDGYMRSEGRSVRAVRVQK